MKAKNLLLISLIFISCNNNKSNQLSNKIIDKNKTIKDTIIVIKNDTATDKLVKDAIKIDSIKENKPIRKDPKLKVIIDGKVYYKKNVGDHRSDSRYVFKYIYWDIKKKREYNIKTGQYNYGPPVFATGKHTPDNDPAYRKNK